MTCKIAQNINNNKLNSSERKVLNFYGARVLNNITNTEYNPKTKHMAIKKVVDFKQFEEGLKDLDKHEAIKTIQSAIFTSGKFSLDALRNSPLDTALVDSVVSREIGNLSEESINRVNKFLKGKGRLINATMGKHSPNVFLTDMTHLDKSTAINGKDVIVITDEDIDHLLSDDNKSGDSSTDIVKFLTKAALHRGYDIVFTASPTVEGLVKGLASFNSNGKITSGNARLITNIKTLGVPGAVKFTDISSMFKRLKNMDSKPTPMKYEAASYGTFVDAFLNEDERTTIDKKVAVMNSDKLVVANSLFKNFKKVLPNLEYEVITTAEIKERYGNSFSSKKGFIIGGKIVMNLNMFNNETMFHEFGHFFSNWLHTTDAAMFEKLMSPLRNSPLFEQIQNSYRATGINFSENEIIEEVFARKFGMNGAKEFSRIVGDVSVSEDIFDKTVEDFVEEFTNKLIGSISYNGKLNKYATVNDIVNFQLDNYNVNTDGLLSDHGVMESFANFIAPRVKPENLFSQLLSRGFIRELGKTSDGHIELTLTDTSGNYVDENNNLVDKPISLKYYTVVDGKYMTSDQVRSNNNLIKKLLPYLDANKDIATVMFNLGSPTGNITAQSRAEQAIRDATKGVVLDTDKGVYVKNGYELKRVSNVISEDFSYKEDEDKYIMRVVYRDLKKELSEKYALDSITDPEVRKSTEDKINREIFNTMQDKQALKNNPIYQKADAIFEGKRNEGTFLHGVSELLIRSLNLVQKIDYDTQYEKTYSYFIKNIMNAIANPSKNERIKYFQEYIIDRVAGTPLANSVEYQEFLSILQETNDYMLPEDSQRVTNYLLKLEQTLNDNIFNVLEGPLVFIPEVKLADENLGMAGTVDLVVIDKQGIAHVYDYKTKESGKERNWDYASGVSMKSSMKGYQSNAMMKASLQTSLYKLMIGELGVDTGSAKVFYVAGYIDKQLMNADAKTRFVYEVANISVKELADVSTELHTHYKDKLKNMGRSNFSDSLKKFISIASGEGNIDEETELDKRANSILDRAITEQNNKTEANGIPASIAALIGMDTSPLFIKVEGTRYKMPPHIKSKKDRVEYIKNMIREHVPAVTMEQSMERLFNGGEIASRDKKEAMASLLGGANTNSHIFIKLSSMADFGNASAGITMIQDRITKEVRIMVLNHEEDSYLKFDNDKVGGDSRNIFGNFASREFAKTLTDTEWKATRHNMKLIQVGLMMMRMKKMDPSFTVSNIISNEAEAKKGVPRLEDVSTILEMTTNMIKVMKDSGETVPPDILELLEDDNVTYPRNYMNNPVRALADYLSLSSDTSYGFKEDSLFKSPKNKGYKDDLIEELRNYKEGDLLANVFNALHNFRNTLQHSLKSEEAKLNSPLWELTDNTIMFLMGFNYGMSPKNPGFVDRFLATPSKAANLHESSFNRKIMSVKASLNNEYSTWKTEFNKRLEALAAEYGMDIGSPTYKFSKKIIFENLFKDPTNTDRSKAFILKSPNDVSSQAEKDMLTFMRDSFQDYAQETVHKDIKIPYGWMPLMTKSKLSLQSETSNPLELARNLLLGIKQDSDLYGEEAKLSDDMAYRNNNPFEGQMPRGDSDVEKVQFSYARRKKLGIDIDGNETFNASEKNLNMIEDNLENVMDAFVMASLETKYYRDVTAFGRAMMMNVKRMEKLSNVKYRELISTLDVIQKRVINNETSEKKSKLMSRFNSFATQVAISGTVSQVLLETFTNPMVTASNYFADKLYGVLYNGQRKFSAESYRKAIKMVWADSAKRKVINKIDELYGITSSDTSQLKDVLNQLEKKSLFQSDNLMFLNRMMLDNWQKVTMAAALIEQGSFDAYSLDEYGNLRYDEDKDDKFNPVPSDTKEDIEYKRKVYEATKKELGKVRGGLTGNESIDYAKRKLNRSLTEYERNDMKELIAQVYSSMDEESKGLAMYYTALGFMSKMKSWIFPKMPRYFQDHMTAEENASMRKLVKVNAPH